MTGLQAALTVTMTLAGLAYGAHRLLLLGFRVSRQPPTTDPAALGLAFESVRFATRNGKTLSAWYLPAVSGAPAVVVMHGWGASAESLLPLGADLNRAGHAVLLPDARGHGASDPDSFSSMPRFAEDIEAGLDWIKARPGMGAARLAVVGHSVGGAAALLAASRRDDLDAVVSLSAFDHPERVMRTWLARAHIPYRPLGWLICRHVERVIGHRFDDIAPRATIGRVQCQVLIGHGSEDDLVPAEAAVSIHAGGDADRVRLLILPGYGHDRPTSFEHLGRTVVDFLAEAARRAEGSIGRACRPPNGSSQRAAGLPGGNDPGQGGFS
jgi:pimeloyl-ACP methyl ester carboxylesterase